MLRDGDEDADAVGPPARGLCFVCVCECVCVCFICVFIHVRMYVCMYN